MTAGTARQLAYYQAFEGFGVLAPRGWYCFGVYGSNGGALFVGPQRLTTANFFDGKWTGFDGPAIELSSEFAGTSGRFAVARVVARAFPAHKAFADAVIAEGVEPDISFGPYPADKLTYRGDKLVEFETPANTDGLGTMSRLKKNASPISGVTMLLGPELDLVQLSVRLPEDQTALIPVIVKQVEQDAMQPPADK